MPNPIVALDRRATLAALGPRRGERVLDAGCGTAVHLAALRTARSRAVGLDFSRGMLRVAHQKVLSALVSEHLADLRRFFEEAFSALRGGGRPVFSAFHPELARAGRRASVRGPPEKETMSQAGKLSLQSVTETVEAKSTLDCLGKRLESKSK